jgi:hypothetical protein
MEDPAGFYNRVNAWKEGKQIEHFIQHHNKKVE